MSEECIICGKNKAVFDFWDACQVCWDKQCNEIKKKNEELNVEKELW